MRIPGNRYEFLPLLGAEDLHDIEEIVAKYSFDYLCVPNVITVKDILEVKTLVKKHNIRSAVLPKIDSVEGVH